MRTTKRGQAIAAITTAGATAAYVLGEGPAAQAALATSGLLVGSIVTNDIAHWARTEGRSRSLRTYTTMIETTFIITTTAAAVVLAWQLAARL